MQLTQTILDSGNSWYLHFIEFRNLINQLIFNYFYLIFYIIFYYGKIFKKFQNSHELKFHGFRGSTEWWFWICIWFYSKRCPGCRFWIIRFSRDRSSVLIQIRKVRWFPSVRFITVRILVFSISSPGPIFTIEELWSNETFRGHSIGHMKSALQYGINILIRLKKFSVNTNHV